MSGFTMKRPAAKKPGVADLFGDDSDDEQRPSKAQRKAMPSAAGAWVLLLATQAAGRPVLVAAFGLTGTAQLPLLPCCLQRRRRQHRQELTLKWPRWR
jgi:hypothetical protein